MIIEGSRLTIWQGLGVDDYQGKADLMGKGSDKCTAKRDPGLGCLTPITGIEGDGHSY
ncbi:MULTISPECIES: hypothetical protein [unclassified Neptuniibacter]|uniref:hypothetical protein n=1 Tax=unclassified Neptuniibacter TaxID=2630693 RepID=UPI0025F9D390|nr:MULTISPECIES: hypothetical protein [unclassified Neptuniibacter]